VHYFDRTDKEKLGEHYGPKLELWLATIHDAIGFAARDRRWTPGVSEWWDSPSVQVSSWKKRHEIRESERLANIRAAWAMISQRM
jgi:hypothetical protein